MCVHIHPIMIKVHPVVFKSSFWNQAVLSLRSEWRSSVQAPPTIVDWQARLTLATPPEWLRAVCLRCRRRQERLWLSDWGVLLLDVIMNIAVVGYSWHLSRWRCRGLTFLSLWRECADPNLPKCVCSHESFVISFIYRRSEFMGFYESLQITFPHNVLVS